MTQKVRINYLTYLVGVVSINGMTSCSKNVTYTAPVALSQEYISSLSYEKQMAYKFVTAPKVEASEFETFMSNSFKSNDQNWGGEKDAYLKKRNTDFSFSQIEPIRILQNDSLVAVHSRTIGDIVRLQDDFGRSSLL